MIRRVSRKRVFRNIFKSTRGRIYKRRERSNQPTTTDAKSSRPGSILFIIMTLIVAHTLREIKYYQSVITVISILLSKDIFMRLVQEVT
jgi:hypothetical protein